MSNPEPTVFVVDDDEALCEAIRCLLEAERLRVATYPSAEAFLADLDPDLPGCLVLDVRMRGMSGLDLQAELNRRDCQLPVLILTGHGDVPMAVRAVKAGATDFLEKPASPELLLDRIRRALTLDSERRPLAHQHRDTRSRLRTLTARELQVLEMVVQGLPSKQISVTLDISKKTVEAHRRHIMQKMGVHNAIDLVRVAVECRGHQRNHSEP